jgi:hypothetical protein
VREFEIRVQARDRITLFRMSCNCNSLHHRYPRLLIQACFRHQQALQFRHQSSIRTRHETVPSPHPQPRPSRPALLYRTRHLGTTVTPLRHMTESPPTIVLPRKPVVLPGRDAAHKNSRHVPSNPSRYSTISRVHGGFRECSRGI